MTPLLMLFLLMGSAPPADLASAWKSLRAGEVTAARAAFEQALLASPEDVEALDGLGFTALREQRLEDAGHFFARALAQSPRDRDAQVGQALVDERSGAPEVALPRILAVLESHPADEEAKGLRTRLEAMLLSLTSAHPPAEQIFAGIDLPELLHGTWVELSEGEWEPLPRQQWRTWDQPRFPSFGDLSHRIQRAALRSIATVSDVGIGSAARRLDEARAARDAGKLEEGIRLYRALIDDPNPTVRGTALEGLALLESWRGDYGPALTHYRMLGDRFPERWAAAILGEARTMGWTRRYTEALALLDQALQDHPDDKELILLEAQVAGWAAMIPRSMAAYRRVLEIDPDDLAAQRGLAKVLAWGGRLAESEVKFQTFLSEYPDDEPGLIGMTYTLMWQGRPYEAERWLDRVDLKSQGSKDYRIVDTALQWALGERAMARQQLRELMWRSPGEPDARDLWRAQTGVVGPFTRTDSIVLRDNEGLRVETLSLQATAPVTDPAFVFAEARQEWLEQNGSPVGVKGGRVGLDWAFGRRWQARGSLGVRRSDVDTGGWTGGGTVSRMIGSDWALSAGVDSDFPFYTPASVRSDVRMTSLTLTASRALTSRLIVSAEYARAHYAASEGSPQPEIDQNRDTLTVKARHFLVGYQASRIDVGALGYFFRFDRTFDTGYWNPQRFRQVMGTVAATQHDGGQLWTFITEVGLGMQSQDDQSWKPAASLHGEFLRQFGRRFDLTGRLSYGNSGLAYRTDSTGYWNWSAALGFKVRLGSRNPRGSVEVPEDLPPVQQLAVITRPPM